MRAASGAAGRFRKALKDGGGMRKPVSRAPASHRATDSFPMAAASSRVDPCVWSRGMSGTLTTNASSSADHSITRA